MAGNQMLPPAPRVQAMDLSALARRLNAQQSDSDSDDFASDGSNTTSDRVPRRWNTMDFSTIARRPAGQPRVNSADVSAEPRGLNLPQVSSDADRATEHNRPQRVQPHQPGPNTERAVAYNRPRRVQPMDFSAFTERLNLQQVGSDSGSDSDSEQAVADTQPPRFHTMDFSAVATRRNLQQRGFDADRAVAYNRPRRVQPMDFSAFAGRLNLQQVGSDSDSDSDLEQAVADAQPPRPPQPPRFHTMDLSAFTERLNLLQRDFAADRAVAYRRRRRRVQPMDFSAFAERLNLQFDSDASADSGEDSDEITHTHERQANHSQFEERLVTRDVGLLAEQTGAPVTQAPSQWTNVGQEDLVEFEEIPEEVIEAAIVRRTSTASPGKLDFNLDFEGQSEQDEDDSWSRDEMEKICSDEPMRSAKQNDDDIPTPSII